MRVGAWVGGVGLEWGGTWGGVYKNNLNSHGALLRS
jgi:hypothetical protein